MEKTADSKLNHNLFLCMHVCVVGGGGISILPSQMMNEAEFCLSNKLPFFQNTHTQIFAYFQKKHNR